MAYRYLLEVGDLSYRLGRPLQAYKCFRRARLLRSRFDTSFPGVELTAAAAALRSGLFAEAASLCEDALRDADLSAPARAATLAFRGIVAAEMCEPELAVQWIDRAIDLAADPAAHSAVVRVALAAAKVCCRLGKLDEAQEAYSAALSYGVPDRTAEHALCRLTALLGLAGCSSVGDTLLVDALRLMPTALEVGESWWSVRRLLEGLARADGPSCLDAVDLVQPLAALVIAASQRRDCTRGLAALFALRPALREVSSGACLGLLG